MKVVLTGAAGFLGWHLRCRLLAMSSHVVIPVARPDFDRLRECMTGADTVVHAAGINRGSDWELVQGNVELAEAVADAVRSAGTPVRLVFANSIRAGDDTPYGEGKAAAAAVLAKAAEETGSVFVDLRLPNLFGEHGRPHYNSFVATFCHELADGLRPDVVDREVPLLHVQQAASDLMRACVADASGIERPVGEPRLVSEVLRRLERHRDFYSSGAIPPLEDPFDVDLFNTYRSHVFPTGFPHRVPVNVDTRGDLFECIRAHGGTSQTFVSTTAPGQRRGDHFHLRKVERFFVLSGRAEIALRRLHDSALLRFVVDGRDRAFVDMPTLWTHHIRNVGDDELVTLFWTDQLFDPSASDTYHEPVETTEVWS